MLKKVAVILLIIFIASQAAFAEVTKGDIDRAISKNKLVHPYLYFSEKDKPAMLERINNDPEFGNILNKLLSEANRLIYTPMPSHLPVQTKTPRYSGDELEGELGTMAESAFKLAFAYQMTGDEKYAQKAFEFVDIACDQPTWVPGAHLFPTIYDRVWPWGAKDDQVVFSYGQHTDHMFSGYRQYMTGYTTPLANISETASEAPFWKMRYFVCAATTNTTGGRRRIAATGARFATPASVLLRLHFSPRILS